jgi:nucleotide-binding universal stress UspA family protein
VKNILVGIEDCEATTIASPLLQRAIELATAFAGKVWLVHVVRRVGEPPFDFQRSNLRRAVAEAYRHEREFLHHLEQGLRDRGVEAGSLLVEGSPTAALIEECAHLHGDLIIVGCYRHGTTYSALLEPTEEGLVSKCRCPMMFVPLPAE